MSTEKRPAPVFSAVSEFLWLAAAIWLVFGYLWPTLCPQEVPTIRAMLDPRLFKNDFAVQEFLRFTPRFYYNLLIYLPAAAGVPLPWVCAGWQIMFVGLLVTGLRAMARGLGMETFAAALFVVWALQVGTGDLGLTYLYIPSPAPGVWAIAVAAWGGAFAVQHRWRAAFVCFGVAVLLQFLVGFYAGLLLLPALWRERGGRALVLDTGGWVLGVAAVYLPMKLGGITGGSDLTSAAFVEIYAQLRHPHHMVPTFWPRAAWLEAGLFYLGGLACAVRLGPPATTQSRWWLGGVVGLSAALLVVNYLGVELWPSALITKLQFARTTPFAALAILAAVGLAVQQRLAQRDYVGAGLLAVAPFSAFPGLLLLLSAVLLHDAKPGWTSRQMLLAVATASAYYEPHGITVAHLHYYLTCLAALGALCAVAWLRQRGARLALAGSLALAGALGCAAATTTSHWPDWLRQHLDIDAAPFNPPGVLGRNLSHYAPIDAVVLLPPITSVGAFKLHANRAIVVDIQHFPMSDRGIAEWWRRISDILGVPYTRGMNTDAVWAAEPPARIAAMARKYGARYVLTRDSWHPALPGRRVDRVGDWSIWDLDAPP